MDVKYFDGITPKIIDKKIEKFCRKINYHKRPYYVDVQPINGAKFNECFNNVKQFIELNSGKCIHGWIIWLHPHCMLEAEFHAICKTSDNQFIDVTPHKNNESKILFLEDDKLIYEGFGINNIRENISRSKLIDDCIKAWNEVYKMLYTGKNKNKYGEIVFAETEAQKLAQLNNFIQDNLYKFYANLKLKPNDECICGSGIKFIDCCKYKFK